MGSVAARLPPSTPCLPFSLALCPLIQLSQVGPFLLAISCPHVSPCFRWPALLQLSQGAILLATCCRHVSLCFRWPPSPFFSCPKFVSFSWSPFLPLLSLASCPLLQLSQGSLFLLPPSAPLSPFAFASLPPSPFLSCPKLVSFSFPGPPAPLSPLAFACPLSPSLAVLTRNSLDHLLPPCLLLLSLASGPLLQLTQGSLFLLPPSAPLSPLAFSSLSPSPFLSCPKLVSFSCPPPAPLSPLAFACPLSPSQAVSRWFLSLYPLALMFFPSRRMRKRTSEGEERYRRERGPRFFLLSFSYLFSFSFFSFPLAILSFRFH